MTIYFGDGIGDDPIEPNRDKKFTDDGYMVIGGQLIDLNDKPAKENKKDSQINHIDYDQWPFS